MSDIWRDLLDKDLAEYKEKLPEYTLGQTIFSMMTVATEGAFTKESLLTISDEDLYKVCRISLKREITPVNDQL